ncbi:reverse transcriptase, partial [Phytophthora megakarya]
MCRRVEDLLEACDKWNLSISVAKSFWGMDEVGYLGHRVSIGDLEANPKDLKSLTDLPFSGSLRSMQSFLGSLNYYSRFIEDYAINASVLYELREVEFAEAFITLKAKIETTPILRDFDETRTPVVIVYVSDWAISASLTQEHDGIYHPVAFAIRTLKTNELDYNVTEKEVLALLRILDLYYNLLVGREIRMLEITKCAKGEDEILGAIAASITPRAKMDDALTEIAPRKEPKRRIQAPIPTVDREEELWVVSFDGSARVKRGGGAFSAIVWSLPGWEVVKARSGYHESLTLNEAEYNGLILGLDMLEDLDHKRLVICGDSNLVIRQVRGEIDCKAPGLTLLKRQALDRLRKWRVHELVHVKRDWNGSADSLASAALQRQGGIEVQKMPGYQDLVTLNRLDEILIPRTENPVVRVAAITTRGAQVRSPAGVMQEDLIRDMRVDRIKQAQEEEVWVAGMKKYLSGSNADLTQAEARSYGKIAVDYEVDEQDLLFYCPPTPRSGE